MAGGHPNISLYCANDPVNGKDPSGLQEYEDDIFTQVGVREDRMGGRRGPGAARGKRAIAQAKSAAQFTLELIPIEQYRKAVSGKNCWNQNVGAGERIFIFATAASGGGSAGKGFLSRIKGWFSRGNRGKPKNPLENIVYTGSAGGKIRDAVDPFHSFPREVELFGQHATRSTIKGGDGITRTQYQLHGTYRGYEGYFEWIIEPDGVSCTHRMFRMIKKIGP